MKLTLAHYFVYHTAFATISYHPATDSFYVDYTDPWADIGETAGVCMSGSEHVCYDDCNAPDVMCNT